MRKIKTATEELLEAAVTTAVVKTNLQPEATEAQLPERFEITEPVMEYGGLSYFTEKLSEAGNLMPKSITFYNNKERFRFTGSTAEELYSAINELTLSHPDVGFGAVLKVDKEIKNPDAGGLKLLLEMVPGTEAKLETWIVKDKKTGLPELRHAYALHKGHVTGAIGFRVRLVKFGAPPKLVEAWAGRE